MRLIPCHTVGHRRALVVLQVLQERRLHGYVEIVALVGAYGYEARSHREAVEVT